MKTLAQILPIKNMWTKVDNMVEDYVGRWDVPNGADVPEDLRDVQARFFGTKDGRRLSGLLLPSDMLDMNPEHPVIPVLLALLPICALCFAFGSFPGFLGSLAAIAIITVLLNAISPKRAIGLSLLAYVVPLAGAMMSRSMAASSAKASWSTGAGLSNLKILASPEMLMSLSSLAMPVVGVALAGMFVLALFSGFRMSAIRQNAVVMSGVMGLAIFSGMLPAPLKPFFFFGLGAIAPWLHVRWDKNQRGLLLVAHGSNLTGEDTGKLSTAHLSARITQAANAKKDTSPAINIGTSMGVFTKKFDNFAPDANKAVVTTVNDLSTNAMVVGGIGTGKTSFLRHVVVQWLRAKAGGVLLLCAKGALPPEFRGMKNYLLVEPGIQLGLLEGLSPNDVVMALYSTGHDESKSSSGSSEFFTKAANEMLRHMAELLHSVVEAERHAGTVEDERQWRWTLHDLDAMRTRVISMNVEPGQTERTVLNTIRFIKDHHPEAGKGGLLDDAIAYATVALPAMDEDTRSNIAQTVAGWITPIMSHKDLLPWAKTEKGEDISTPLRGGVVGVNVPDFKFGKAGLQVQALIRMRLFTSIRRRADNPNWAANGETRVLFVMDEAQELVGEADRQILGQSRSLGAVYILATQSVDKFHAKLGDKQATAFLGDFKMPIALSSTFMTYQWISQAVGMTQQMTIKHGGKGSIDFVFTARLARNSPLFDRNHPNAKQYRKLVRKGAGMPNVLGKFYNAEENGSVGVHNRIMEESLNPGAAIRGGFEYKPLIEQAEFESYTAEPFVAVVQVQRGGVKRRDVVKLNTLFAIPKEFLADD